MAYLVLARKYRPQRFDDLTGQQTTARILQSAIGRGRVASAYLFSGPRGIGKTTSARIFAKALNCKRRNPEKDSATFSEESIEPCNQCDSCQEILKGSSMDVLELDAASHTQVEKIREVIIDSVAFAPARDLYKVFIIDEVHMLSSHSFNALLKTLEEPPAHVVFILATTDFHKIPLTVSSRCQRFRFLPLTQKEIFECLRKIANLENISVDDSALQILAKQAGGSMRDALSLFDQVISNLPLHSDSKKDQAPAIDRTFVEEILGVVRGDILIQFIENVSQKDAKGVLQLTGTLLKEGIDLSYFLKELRESFREMLIHKCGYLDENSLAQASRSLPAEKFSLAELLRNIQLLAKCADQMRWNDLPHLVFECFAVRMCQKTVSADELLDKINNVKKNDRPETEKYELTDSTKTISPQPEIVPIENPPAESAETNIVSADFQLIWQKVLMIFQQSKPFLYQNLGGVKAECTDQRLELTFPKQFSLDTVKRNLALVENTISEVAKKKFLIILKLGEITKQASEEEVQEIPNETFSSIDDSKDSEEFALEDEGVKRILHHFPGKIRQVQAEP